MKILSKALTILAALYSLALALYLILRTAFGDGLWWLAFLNNFAPFYFLPLIVLLTLALLLRVRRMAFLLPFALIGLIWFGPYYLPRSAPAPTGSTLCVLTFNVWGDNRHLPEVEAWLRDMGADLVLMQEVPPSYGEHGLVALRDLYPYQFKQPPELRL